MLLPALLVVFFGDGLGVPLFFGGEDFRFAPGAFGFADFLLGSGEPLFEFNFPLGFGARNDDGGGGRRGRWRIGGRNGRGRWNFSGRRSIFNFWAHV